MTAPERLCVTCETPVPDDASYCPMCGTATATPVARQTSLGNGDEHEREFREKLQQGLGDNYQLRELIGLGGFAAVYAAWDKKLEREVAVKALRSDLVTSRSSIKRFEIETKAIAKLRHPNILAIHFIGDIDDIAFMVMPRVEGESLRTYLERAGQLSVEEALRIATGVANALQVAHDAGIIHRDVKPENILLEGTERHPLLMDFGIAKVVEGASGDITGTGSLVGTPLYMSPEQASGASRIDARSDLYSLGCVLYEMLAGDPPFLGSSAQSIIVRHISEQPTRLDLLRPGLDETLCDVVDWSLSKIPADRFESASAFALAMSAQGPMPTPAVRSSRLSAAFARAQELLQDKGRLIIWAGVLGIVGAFAVSQWLGPDDLPPLDRHKVAVLYFEDLTPGGELRHAVDGFTEGLIDRLSTAPALSVVSRNGVGQFRDTSMTREDIARALNTGTLITGTIEPLGDVRRGLEAVLLRVTLQVTNHPDGRVSEREFTLPGGDIVGAQDSVAGHVAAFLRARLRETILPHAGRPTTTEAWELLQHGKLLQREAEAFFAQDDATNAFATYQRADSVFTLAAAADTAWIEPVLSRGWVARQMAYLPDEDAVVHVQAGLRQAQLALQLAPNHPQALELRGTLRWDLWQFRVRPGFAAQDQIGALAWDQVQQRALQDLEAAVALDPTLARAWMSLYAIYRERWDITGATMAARRAYEEDPYLSADREMIALLFTGSLDLEQFEQARRWCREGSRRFPQDYRFVSCQLWLMVSPDGSPDLDRAWQLVQELEQLSPPANRAYMYAEARMLFGGALGRAGLVDSARRVLLGTRNLATYGIDPELQLLVTEAYMRTVIGDHDEAIDLLEQFLSAEGNSFGEGVHWWWRDLEQHPRFVQLQQASR